MPRLAAYSKTFEFYLSLQIMCSSGNNYASSRFTGSQIPGALTISACNQVNVYFHTDGSVVRTGFNLTYAITSSKLLFILTSENS